VPEQFDTPDYQVLIVAEKYQTGFDQPKLCAMYVDRKLDGLQAVQTLSRLNRTYPDKTKTFVLDFQNTIEDIRSAFKPWFESSELEERTNPNQVFDLRNKILTSGFINEDDIEGYAECFFKPKLTARDRLLLESFVRPAVERFESAEEDEQESLRQLLNSYRRFYSFVAQIFPVGDPRLEKLYAYMDMLAKMLPGRDKPADVEITSDMLRLTRAAIARCCHQLPSSVTAAIRKTSRRRCLGLWVLSMSGTALISIPATFCGISVVILWTSRQSQR
jgi:type I restriction enzyme R subunit